jgi:hypothetical protein
MDLEADSPSITFFAAVNISEAPPVATEVKALASLLFHLDIKIPSAL